MDKVALSVHDRGIIERVRNILPDLRENHHKGSHGRVGIIGGSEEYTGAPYFAGISALRVGADLVHVFCVKGAAQPIKSYSPDIIVHPLLDRRPDAVDEIAKWLERLHVMVIGPGLGQDAQVLDNVKLLLQRQEMRDKKLVIDADGLKLFDEIASIPGLTGILTPNAREFERLDMSHPGILSGRFVVMRKGEEDSILKSSSDKIKGADFAGSGRRCGGQGDLLAGAISILFHWATSAGQSDPAVTACQGASLLIRLCNFYAFAEQGRGTLAADMIEQIPRVFRKYFEREDQ